MSSHALVAQPLTACDRRRGFAFVVSLLITFGLHVLLVLHAAPLLQRAVRRDPARDEAAAVRKEERKRPEQKQQKKVLQFVLVDPDVSDEDVDPDTAVAEAAHSRLAREPAPDPRQDTGLPRTKGDSPILPSLPSRRLSPGRDRELARLQRPAPQRLQLQRPRPQTNAREERPRPQPHPDGSEAPAPARKQVQRQQPQRPAEPVFKDIRKSGQPGREVPPKKSLTQARWAGTRSMALLKARYPAYLEKVLRQWVQAVHRQEALAHSTYKTGAIYVRIAIQPDGGIGKLKVLHAPEEMLAERHITVASIRDAAPFPPLTDEMQKDPLFQSVVFQLVFR